MKKRSITAHKKAVWSKFSKWIRQREAVDGYVKCCTCPTVRHWKEMQAGHGIHCGRRGKELIRFHPKNVHAQCGECNTGQKSNNAYVNFLIKRYESEIFNELGKLEYVLHSWKHEELSFIEEILKGKVSDKVRAANLICYLKHLGGIK